MEFFTVEEKPLVTPELYQGQKTGAYTLNEGDGLFVLAVPIKALNGNAYESYYIGSINDSLQIEDGCGDDLGFDVFAVSRWAVFEPPVS